jgi:hypothetical protein
MKPNPPPVETMGFCQGCGRHGLRLTLVREHRYRCDECSVIEALDVQEPPPFAARKEPDRG